LAGTRLERILEPPEGVTWNLDGGRLTLRGLTDRAWYDLARRVGSLVPGVDSVDSRELRVRAEPTPELPPLAWQRLLDALQAEPGIELLSSQRESDRWVARVLRDPQALDPHELLEASGLGLDRYEIRDEAFISLQPEIVRRRVEARLRLGGTLTWDFDRRPWAVQGEVSAEQRDRIAREAAALPGLPPVDWTGLTVRPTARERERLQLQEILGKTEGLAVTSVEDREGRFWVEGLRDELSDDPVNLLQRIGLDPRAVSFRWRSYVSLDPDIVVRRLTAALSPPPGVALQIENGRLRVVGEAPEAWLRELRGRARGLPGVSSIDLGAFQQSSQQEIARLKTRLETTVVPFNASARAPAESTYPLLDSIARDLTRLVDLVESLGGTGRVIVIGMGDSSGNSEESNKLAGDRSAQVLARLLDRGVSRKNISTAEQAALLRNQKPETGEFRGLDRGVRFRYEEIRQVEN
ncbi:MAG: hypothetical protein KDB53_21315, partial [Planctomycetes bacterium]|nr:hypothetical protein [Planctomycetota bacterium]